MSAKSLVVQFKGEIGRIHVFTHRSIFDHNYFIGFQLYIRFNNIRLRLTLQVNNAGVAPISVEYEPNVTIFDTNYFGMKNVTKAMLPLLRDSPTGPRIVNVSSLGGALEVLYLPHPFPFSTRML